MHFKSAIVVCALYSVAATQQCVGIPKPFHYVASTLFKVLDKHNSGHITETEFKPVFNTLFNNVDGTTLDAGTLLKNHISNGDKKVDSCKFVKMVYEEKNAKGATLADKLRQVAYALFNTLDIDRNGNITGRELKPVSDTLLINDDDTPVTDIDSLLLTQRDVEENEKTDKVEFANNILSFYKIQ